MGTPVKKIVTLFHCAYMYMTAYDDKQMTGLTEENGFFSLIA